MGKRWKMRVAAAALALSTLMVPAKALASDGSSYVYDGYTYDFYLNAKESPAMFQLERTITSENMAGVPMSGVNDVCTSQDGRIFTIDTTESRMNVCDANGGICMPPS